MDHVKMIPNPNKNRYLSGHDDGFHFSNCKGQINITHCEFAALMDDPVNIHGISVRIIKKLGPNQTETPKYPTGAHFPNQSHSLA